jgi:FkbM family methyltransferase
VTDLRTTIGLASIKWYSRGLRVLPIYSGLTRLSFNSFTNNVFGRLETPLVATMLDGTRIEVDPNDYHGRILYLFGVGDRKVFTVVRSLLWPADHFLDIGANYGSVGLLVSPTIGKRGEVHLFEPQSFLCGRIETALAQFGFSNVRLHAVALLDRDGELTLARPASHSGMATLVEHSDQSDWVSERVEVRDTATYLSGLVGDRWFGAKLDVEGAEPFIMPWLLAQLNLRFLLFEAAHNQNQLFSLVREAGLTLYGLRRTVLRCRVRRVDAPSDLSDYHDVVAVRLRPGSQAPRDIHPIKLRQDLGPGEYREHT